MKTTRKHDPNKQRVYSCVWKEKKTTHTEKTFHNKQKTQQKARTENRFEQQPLSQHCTEGLLNCGEECFVEKPKTKINNTHKQKEGLRSGDMALLATSPDPKTSKTKHKIKV